LVQIWIAPCLKNGGNYIATLNQQGKLDK